MNCHVENQALPHADFEDVNTLVAGVRKRFLSKPPMKNRPLMRKLKRFVRGWLRKNMKPLAPDTDLTFEHWLEQTSYPLWRKEELRKAYLELPNLKDPKKKYLQCKSFMKDEHYTAYKHARAINSRTDVFKCAVAPIFKAIEKELFKRKEFIKKVPVLERAAYIRDMLYRPGSKYIATDYTSFEALFDSILMDCVEFELYDFMTEFLPGGEEFMELCRDVIGGRNRCQFKRFAVEVTATRMSGEMNTSLGNSFANLMLMLFACKEAGSKAYGVVEGDDGLFRIEGPVPKTSFFEDMGLIIKLQEFDKLEHASFCGLVFDIDNLVICADPLKTMTSFGWASRNYLRVRNSRIQALLRCKALSLAYQYPGCPIVGELAHHVLRRTSHVRKSQIDSLINSRLVTTWRREQYLEAVAHDIPYKPVANSTRFLVEDVFGCPVSTQLYYEKYFKSDPEIQPIPGVMVEHVTHPHWSHYARNYVFDKDVHSKDLFYPGELWQQRGDPGWKDLDGTPLISHHASVNWH